MYILHFGQSLRGNTTVSLKRSFNHGRRRLRKRHFKSEFAQLQTLSRLFHLCQFVKCSIPKNCIDVQEKKRKSESHFSRRSGAVTATQCTKKRDHVQSCMFCQYKLIAFMSFSLKSPSSLLKFRNIVLVGAAINVYKLVNSSKLSQKFPPSLFARRSRTRASKLNFPCSIVC